MYSVKSVHRWQSATPDGHSDVGITGTKREPKPKIGDGPLGAILRQRGHGYQDGGVISRYGDAFFSIVVREKASRELLIPYSGLSRDDPTGGCVVRDLAISQIGVRFGEQKQAREGVH